ncbi:MAG: class I SAM-dependent methyltransferase [Acidimicrobiia bacterium]
MPPWQAKVLAQQAFSLLPGGHRLNYVFQRHLTHGLPIGDEALHDVIEIAQRHLDGLAMHSDIPVSEGRFFEFGAGWDLHVPQVLYCLGIERQHVVDIRRLLRTELVLDIRDRLATLDAPLVRRPPTGATELDAYLADIGVVYDAPRDARATGLAGGSIDFVTSTNTLEHIPREDIVRILDECGRILSSRGAMSFQVDYKDHYSYFDRRLDAYHFLRYEDRAWRRYNPSLHYQNRLRHSDYLALYSASGFDVSVTRMEPVTEEQKVQAEAAPRASHFQGYELDDLSQRNAIVVLTPTSRQAREHS